jgi:hypothetical protein
MSDKTSGATASTDRFTPVEGPYTCCETTFSGECTGFHITAPEHGSIAPLARYEKWLMDGGYGDNRMRDTGYLLAASWDLLKALERLHRSYLSFLKAGMKPDSDAAYALQDAHEEAVRVIHLARGER